MELTKVAMTATIIYVFIIALMAPFGRPGYYTCREKRSFVYCMIFMSLGLCCAVGFIWGGRQ